MKIAYVTEYGNWLKNQMFIETASCNVNNVLDRYIALKGFLEQQGVHLNTFDMYGSISEVDIWLMQEPTPAILEFILKNNIDPSRVIYFLHEPPVYNYWGWDYIRKSHYLYEAVLTWETTSTKANRKFFHYHFPVKFDPAKREHYLKKEKKNLCFIMHSNKTSQVPGELYSFRRNVITYFEKRGDRLLDLYGHGWNSDKAPSPFFTDLYKGTTPDKRETYAEYHFSICIDNCISPGYITYDPLISMITGTVPVYIPMPDAKEYIPEDTFIDMSRFKTLEELTDRLLSIRGTDTYEQIRKSGWEFVTSERYHPFTVEKFSKDVFAAIRYVGERLSSRKNGKAAMVPPEKAQKYLNPHFTGFLPMQNGIRYDEMDPALFFSHKRFDLPAKYIYVKHREMGVGSDWARRMYSEHIRAFNGYREPDGSGKEGEMAFIDSFDAIIDSVRAKGFDESMSMVPVTHSGDLIEGSHRVAACMYYRIPLKTLGFSFDTWAYPYSFFLERGLSREHCDAIAYEHCKLKENTYLVLLFPSAVGRDEEVRTILQRYGSILYEKEVRLFNNGPLLLMTQIYKNENWLGDISNNFGGARLKVQECFRTDSPLRVLLIETDNPQKLKDAKDEIRAVYRISNHSVHINDTHEETVRVSQLLFNENSIHFLNHATPGAFPRFQRHYGTLRQFCAGKDLNEMELLCLTGSAVMALYGIRDARDIDYFHFRDALPEDPSGGLGSHNKEIRHYTMTRDDIIFNPENHFYFDGFKFASLEVVRAMKEKRGEEKDRVDIELIRNFSGMDSKGASPQQGPGPNRPKTSPVVSVIILNYNGFEDLRLCIDSISRNTSEPYEIVVFDNASTDNSLPYLRTLPGVHLVESPVNLGCPAGRAQAMTHIHPASRYVIFLDNDTIVTKGWTTKFIAHAQRDPSIGMMGPRSNYVSGAQLVRGAAYSNVGELESFAAQWSDQAGETLTPTLRLVGFCMFITRDVVDKIGSIDASFGKFGFEDDDYTWRTVVAGFKAMIANNIFIHHKGGPQGQGNTVYNEALAAAWETFKNKWGIPKEVSYGSPFDISAVLTRPYNAGRDHIPLVLKRDGGASLDEAFSRAKEATDRGDVDGAIAVFNELLINDPDSGVIHAALGTLFAGKKEYGKARDSFIKALTAMPSETGLCLQLADVCVQLNETGNARQILEAVLSREPGNAEIIARLVDVLVASEQFGEAVETVKNALIKDPKNPDLIAIFGHLAAVIGNRDALRTCIEKLREIDPSHRAVDILEKTLDPHQEGPIADSPISLAFVKLRDYSLDPHFLKTIQEVFNTDVFIETGTFTGNTTLSAAGLFREVHTVELSESLFNQVRSRFQKTGNVHAYHGDSASLLPGIIEKTDGKILFWLDGHYSGEGTARTDKDTPIIEEIEAITRSGKKDSVIMIDDIRLFPTTDRDISPAFNGYPPLTEVCKLIKAIDDAYQCVVFGDVLIAYNGDKQPFSSTVQACTVSRLYDGTNFDEATLFGAEDTIRSVQGAERSAIEALYSVFLSDSPVSGYCRLWFALTRMGTGAYADAIRELLAAISNGFTHWRLFFYLAEGYLKTGQMEKARAAIEKALKEAPESTYTNVLNDIIKKALQSSGKGAAEEQFKKDMAEYELLLKNTENRFPINPRDLWCLNERTPGLSFDSHYVLHTSWAARVLSATRPEKHVDISSSIYFSSIVSAFIPVDFYDYRPAPLSLSGFVSGPADVTNLPFPDDSIESLSCMHVVEHIGLGRYGDPIDPDGDIKAINELKRVLKPGGELLFAVPVGKPRLVFNAHRIYSYDQIIGYFDGLTLKDFSLVTDTMNGNAWMLVKGSGDIADQQAYGCGCFRFGKEHASAMPGAEPKKMTGSVQGRSEDGPFTAPGNSETAGAAAAEKGTTVIMVLPEKPDGLQECLRSIVEHTGEEDLEFLFIAKAFGKKAGKLIRQVLGDKFACRQITDAHNRGFVHLVNEGIRQSARELILLLDPSTVVTEGWLQGMKDCFRYATDTGIVGPMANRASEPRQVIKADLTKFGGDINEFAGAFRAQNLHRRFNVFRLSSFCMLFKREFIHRIGLLDPSFDYLLMPWGIDLSIRCSLAGSKNTVAADVYVHRYSHTRHGDTAALLSKWNGADPETGRKLTVLAAIERSQLLFERGKIKDAVDVLIEAIKSAPDHRDIYLRLGRILIDSQAGAEAFDALQAMPDSEKDSPEALELFGYTAEMLDLDAQAEEYAGRLLSARPGSGPALDLKGLLAYKKGEAGNAEGFFRQAIEADPGSAEPHKNLGLLKWTSGEKEEGLALLEKAFVLAPTRNDNGVAYLSAVIDQETYERAEMILSEAKDLHPDSRNIALLFIDLLLRQEKTGAAMSETEKCLVRFGADEGLVNVGLDIRGRLGPLTIDPGKARQGTLSLCMIVKNEEKNIGRSLMSLAPVVDEIIVVDTGSMDGTRDIASIFGAQVLDFAWTNDFSEARNVSLSHARGRWVLVHDADEVISARDHDKLRAIIRENPRQPVAYTLVTRNYTTNPSLGGWTENKGEYPDEESGTGWIPTSKVRLLINDERFRFENPIHEMLEPSLWHAGAEIRSCDVPVHHYGKLDEAKMHEKADMYYLLGKKKLLDADSINLGALRELAVQAAELHRYEEAILLWERYIALEPGNHKAFFNISTCYFETGQFGKALDAAKRALEIDPSSKEAVLGYASVSLCVGDVDEAVSLIEKLFRRTADYPPARVALASAYFMKGMKEEGRKHLERLRSNNYNCSIALHSLVQKLISAGRTEYALCVLEMMEESGNTHQDTARLLREFRDNMVRKRTVTQ